MSAINSPFRYAGGKFYARKLILEHIPKHSIYIEPFTGGGSIFFAKEKAQTNILNDIDLDLINVYQVIRDSPNELILFLQKEYHKENKELLKLIPKTDTDIHIPAKKEIHHYFKHFFVPKNTFEKAGRWFYLNRTSYSGIMNNNNMYWGYGDKYSMTPKNWPRNIIRVSEKLQGVALLSQDFEEIINSAPDGALLFVDPPYFNADQDKFYSHYFAKEDHYRLEQVLKKNAHRLILFVTYDNSPEVRELYNWATAMHDKEWNYCNLMQRIR